MRSMSIDSASGEPRSRKGTGTSAASLLKAVREARAKHALGLSTS